MVRDVIRLDTFLEECVGGGEFPRDSGGESADCHQRRSAAAAWSLSTRVATAHPIASANNDLLADELDPSGRFRKVHA
jgi:hypothetical protein